ncbi:MAG: cyclin-dependent kinase inhibitor 3 family protein [Polyangiales bacterium]
MSRTSVTHPIFVAWARELPTGGRIGITFAPGKKDPTPISPGGAWDRDLGLDLDRLREIERVDLLVSLIEDHELTLLGIPNLLAEAHARGLEVVRFPIPDVDVPGDKVSARLLVESAVARARSGSSVAFHCRGGLGRAGTMTACALVALGQKADAAIARVRQVRPGAIETAAQKTFVRRFLDEELDVSKYSSPSEFYMAHQGRVPAVMMGALERAMQERGLTFPQAWAFLRGKGAIIDIVKVVGAGEAAKQPVPKVEDSHPRRRMPSKRK